MKKFRIAILPVFLLIYVLLGSFLVYADGDITSVATDGKYIYYTSYHGPYDNIYKTDMEYENFENLYSTFHESGYEYITPQIVGIKGDYIYITTPNYEFTNYGTYILNISTGDIKYLCEPAEVYIYKDYIYCLFYTGDYSGMPLRRFNLDGSGMVTISENALGQGGGPLFEDDTIIFPEAYWEHIGETTCYHSVVKCNLDGSNRKVYEIPAIEPSTQYMGATDRYAIVRTYEDQKYYMFTFEDCSIKEIFPSELEGYVWYYFAEDNGKTYYLQSNAGGDGATELLCDNKILTRVSGISIAINVVDGCFYYFDGTEEYYSILDGIKCLNLYPDKEKKSKYSEIDIVVNGVSLQFDENPYITNSTTMVPMRAIFEALGADVTYDTDTKIITAHKGTAVIKLQTGSDIVYINNVPTKLPIPVENKNGHTMIPLRFVSEALGAEVTWNGESKSVFINY
ncbi:MAG: copper amine oxidase N-terminal domain-containing protein [Firmicutes bacterium]|nr:copper amine oxidase N-terminal domain-containing protein [Bacillota bacterium]